MTTTRLSNREAMAYCGPLDYEADGVRIEQFKIGDGDIGNMMAGLKYGRSTRPGTYVKLKVDGTLWMSDTDAEIRDHYGPVGRMGRPAGGPLGDVLIHGLGLGLVTAAAIRHGHNVDVVELDQRIIAAVGPSLEALAAEHGVECRIWCDDAVTKRWPVGQRWAVVWHDIWATICEDNRAEMGTLGRRFGRRCDWQGSWSKATIDRERNRWGGGWR